MPNLTGPSTYVALLLLAGAVLGTGVTYLGLDWTGRLDPPPRRASDTTDTELAEDDLEGDEPTQETVYDTTTVLDTACFAIPSFLVEEAGEPEDYSGALPGSVDASAPTEVEEGGSPYGEPRPSLTPSLSVDAYLLPIVDGRPAITVAAGETTAQVYDPNDLRGRVFRWDHPKPRFTLAPIAQLYTTPSRLRLRLGAELDVVVGPGTIRVEGGIEPTPSSPYAPWGAVTVRPFSFSFL